MNWSKMFISTNPTTAGYFKVKVMDLKFDVKVLHKFFDTSLRSECYEKSSLYLLEYWPRDFISAVSIIACDLEVKVRSLEFSYLCF